VVLQGHLDIVIHSPRNIIFMHKRIEQAFDRQEWCLLVQPDESLKVGFCVKVLAWRFFLLPW
jgi:hypothetical protein